MHMCINIMIAISFNGMYCHVGYSEASMPVETSMHAHQLFKQLLCVPSHAMMVCVRACGSAA